MSKAIKSLKRKDIINIQQFIGSTILTPELSTAQGLAPKTIKKKSDTVTIKKKKETVVNKQEQLISNLTQIENKQIESINTHFVNQSNISIKPEFKILKNETIKITKIIHLADIHIYMDKFHVEYGIIFDKLYQRLLLIKQTDPNCLIVIAGDIFQTKGRLTPILTVIVWNFFKNLSNIFPVIVIAGNHDTYENRSNDIDILTSIFLDRTNDIDNLLMDIHYLRNSGVYCYNNIIFSVSSIIDKYILTKPETDSILIANNYIFTNSIFVALYHGKVRSQRTPYILRHTIDYNNSSVNLTTFDGYDFVMLGDIHLHYFLNDAKTIAYPSSLISHSFSEIDEYHGFILWDIIGRNKTTEYICIPNEFAFKSFKFDDFLTDNNIDDAKIKLHLQNTNKGHIKIVIPVDIYYTIDIRVIESKIKTLFPDILLKIKTSKLHKHLFSLISYNTQIMDDSIDTPLTASEPSNSYSIDIITEIKIAVDKIIRHKNEVVLNVDDKIDITTIPLYQNKLIENKEMNDKIQMDFVSDNWSIEMLFFDNLYTYGENNIIDFSNFNSHSVIGILGPNTFGKTVLLDILTFALFGEPIRKSGKRKGDELDEMINKPKNGNYDKVKARVGIIIKSNRTLYYIYRGIFKFPTEHKGATTFVKLYKMIPVEEYTPLVGSIEHEYVLYNKVYKMLDMTCENTTNKTDDQKDSIIAYISKLIGDKESFIKTSVLNGNNTILKMDGSEKREHIIKTFGLNFFDKSNKKYKEELSVLLSDEKHIVDSINDITGQKRSKTRSKTDESIPIISIDSLKQTSDILSSQLSQFQLQHSLLEQELIFANILSNCSNAICVAPQRELICNQPSYLCNLLSIFNTKLNIYTTFNSTYQTSLLEFSNINIDLLQLSFQQFDILYSNLISNKCSNVSTHILDIPVSLYSNIHNLTYQLSLLTLLPNKYTIITEYTNYIQNNTEISQNIMASIQQLMNDKMNYALTPIPNNLTITDIYDNINQYQQQLLFYNYINLISIDFHEYISIIQTFNIQLPNIISNTEHLKNEQLIQSFNDQYLRVTTDLQHFKNINSQHNIKLQSLYLLPAKDSIFTNYNTYILNTSICCKSAIDGLTQLVDTNDNTIFTTAKPLLDTLYACFDILTNKLDSNNKIISNYTELLKQIEISDNLMPLITENNTKIQLFTYQKNDLLKRIALSTEQINLYNAQLPVFHFNKSLSSFVTLLTSLSTQFMSISYDSIDTAIYDTEIKIEYFNELLLTSQLNLVNKSHQSTIQLNIDSLQSQLQSIQSNNIIVQQYNLLQQQLLDEQHLFSSISIEFSAMSSIVLDYYTSVFNSYHNLKINSFNSLLASLLDSVSNSKTDISNQLRTATELKNKTEIIKLSLDNAYFEMISSKTAIDVFYNNLSSFFDILYSHFDNLLSTSILYNYQDVVNYYILLFSNPNNILTSINQRQQSLMSSILDSNLNKQNVLSLFTNNDALLSKLTNLYSSLFAVKSNIKELKMLAYLTSDNAVQYLLLQKYINMYQDSINRITIEYLKKRIEIKLDTFDDDTKKTNLNVIHFTLFDVVSNKEIPLSSGMESFIFDLVFRMSLSDVSHIPRSAHLFIDEQISVFDKEKTDNINDVFDIIRPYYQHTFIITHIEQVESSFDHIIKIERNEDESFLSTQCNSSQLHIKHLYPSFLFDDLTKKYLLFESTHSLALSKRAYRIKKQEINYNIDDVNIVS